MRQLKMKQQEETSFTVHIRYNCTSGLMRVITEVTNCSSLQEAREKAAAWFKRTYSHLSVISVL